MRNTRRMAAGLVAAGLLSAALPAAAEIADDASAVRPLLVGASAPTASVRDASGEAVELEALLAADPTVLILYRGGW